MMAGICLEYNSDFNRAREINEERKQQDRNENIGTLTRTNDPRKPAHSNISALTKVSVVEPSESGSVLLTSLQPPTCPVDICPAVVVRGP